jgi:hypothetical protein
LQCGSSFASRRLGSSNSSFASSDSFAKKAQFASEQADMAALLERSLAAEMIWKQQVQRLQQ